MNLSDLQSAIVTRLRSQTYFDDIPIISEAKGDLLQEIDLAINRVGVCVLVIVPEVVADQPDHPAANLSVRPILQIAVNPSINNTEAGTRKAASDIGMEIGRVLHFLQNTAGFTRLEFTRLEFIQNQEIAPELIVYQAIFQCRTVLRAMD